MSRSNQPLNTDQTNRNNSTKLAKGTKIMANDDPKFEVRATKADGAALSAMDSALGGPRIKLDVVETNWSLATDSIEVTRGEISDTAVGRRRTS